MADDWQDIPVESGADDWQDIPVESGADDWTDVPVDEIPVEESQSIGQMLRPYVEGIPAATSMAGGAIGATVGAPFLGVGAVPGGFIGAGAGGVVGGALKNAIKRYAYDEELPANAAVEPYMEGAMGMAGEGAGVVIGKGLAAGGKLLTKMSGELSSVPAQVVEKFAERYPQVKKMIEQFGDNIDDAANAIRVRYDQAIRTFKNLQNAKLEKALSESNAVASAKPILEELEQTMGKLDPSTHKAARQEIMTIISNIAEVADQSGGIDNIPVSRLHSIKQMLQESASYGDNALAKSNAANAGMKRAAARANAVINRAAPEVASANRELSRLHSATRKMNKNLITEGAPSTSLIGAGTGQNQKALNELKRVGDIVNEDFVSPVQDLAGMKYLGNAGFLPATGTGRSLAPIVLSGIGGLGGAIQSGDWVGAAKGAALGALASPMALKYALQFKPFLKAVAESASRTAGQNLQENLPRPDVLPSPMKERFDAPIDSPYLLQSVQPPPPPETNIERAKRMNQMNKGM